MLEFITARRLAALVSDAAQKRLAVSAGDTVHVFDVDGDKWLRRRTFPKLTGRWL